MRCLGLNNKRQRCGNLGNPFFCRLHSRQPLGWLFIFAVTVGGFVFGVVGNTASILSYLGRGGSSGPVKTPTPAATPVSSPPALPSPWETVTPDVKTRDTPNRNLQRETAQSSHMQKARALEAQGEYQEALSECDDELRVNPHNNDALRLRGRIGRTIKILKR